MEAALPANSRRSTQTVSGEHEAGVARPLAMARILLGIYLVQNQGTLLAMVFRLSPL
jgi:hypothetical protein